MEHSRREHGASLWASQVERATLRRCQVTWPNSDQWVGAVYQVMGCLPSQLRNWVFAVGTISAEGQVAAIIPGTLTYGFKCKKSNHPFQPILCSLFHVQGLNIGPVKTCSWGKLTSLCVWKTKSEQIYLSVTRVAPSWNWTICRKISKGEQIFPTAW